MAVVLTFSVAAMAADPQVATTKSVAQGGIIFVATNGNDAWSAKQAEPNSNRTDGPFATLPRALRAVRDSRKSAADGKLPSTTICVLGGFYFLQEPLVLRPEDSGLTINGCGKERPVLSGGRRITGWTQANVQGKTLWTADVPEAREGRWSFRELWVNGRRATRARHPNQGYFGIADLPDKAAEWTQGHARFRFREGDLKAWASITNAEVVAMTRWVESRLPVVGVDESQRIVSFSKRSVFELAPGDLYVGSPGTELEFAL